MTTKEWITVTFNKTGQRWIPSFADLHRLIVAIAEVEETKYPSSQGLKGGDFVYDFLRASQKSFATGRSYNDLAKEFRIPDRETERVSTAKFHVEIEQLEFLDKDGQS